MYVCIHICIYIYIYIYIYTLIHIRIHTCTNYVHNTCIYTHMHTIGVQHNDGRLRHIRQVFRSARTHQGHAEKKNQAK